MNKILNETSIIESIDENLIIIDKNMKIKYMNKKAFKTIEKKVVVDKDLISDVFKIYNLETDKRVKINYSDILAKDIKFGLPKMSILKTPSGNKFISASFSSLKNEENTIKGIIILFRDITRIMLNEQSLRQYSEALNRTPVGIIITDSNFEVEYINPEGKKNLKIKDYYKKKNFFEKYKNEVNENTFKEISKELKVKNNISKELLFNLEENEEVWYDLKINKMYFLNELKYIILFSDISNRVKIEKKLIKEKNLLDKIFKQVPTGIIILNENLEIKMTNKYINLHFGDGLINNNINEVIKINEDSPENLYENLISITSFDSKVKREYSLNILKKSYFVEISIIKFFRNSRENYLLSIIDFTENKKMKKALNKSQKNLQHITNNMLDAITTIDLNGKILYASPSHYDLFGYKPSEILGENIKKFICNSDSIDVMRRYKSLLKGENNLDEFLIYKKNGEQIWIEVKFSIAKEDGKDRIIVLSRDATDRINSRNELIKAKYIAEKNDEMKGEFLANTSHEIRTPLNGIIGMATLTLTEDLPENIKENISLIKNSAESLVNIINGILDFSKIEAGKIDIIERKINLKELLETVYKNFQYKAKDKKIKLILENNLKDEFYIGDDGRIKQILINLIGNAIKFTLEGYVKISVRTISENKVANNILFTIKDTGIGIEHKDKKTIFESFAQGDGSYTRRFGGTGLGLSICKMLVEKMHGTIDFESTRGKGSEFMFTLPLKKISENYINDDDLNKIKKIEPLKVLLVEDEETNRKFTKRLLERQGHIVITAKTGVEAVNRVMETYFDMILMDIQMPEMDGIRASNIIKKYLKIDHIPIIAITAHAREKDKKEILSNEIDDYISKPISMKNLSAIIEKNRIKKKNDYTKVLEEVFKDTYNSNENKTFNYEKLKKIIANKDNENLEKELNSLKKIFNESGDKVSRNLIFKSIMALRRGEYRDIEKNIDKISEIIEKLG